MKGWDNCPRCGGSGFTGSPLLCTEAPPAQKQGRKYIAEQWTVFERLCVPKGASPAQRSDMRDAFYAGAFTLLQTLTNEVGNENDTTPEDERLMIAVERELEEHRAFIRARAERALAERQKGERS